MVVQLPGATMTHQDKLHCAIICYLDYKCGDLGLRHSVATLGHLLPEGHIRIRHECFGKNSGCAVILVPTAVAWSWGGQATPGHT